MNVTSDPCIADDLVFDLSRCIPTWSENVDFIFIVLKVRKKISIFVKFKYFESAHRYIHIMNIVTTKKLLSLKFGVFLGMNFELPQAF